MKGFGGMVSCVVKGGFESAKHVVNKTKLNWLRVWVREIANLSSGRSDSCTDST